VHGPAPPAKLCVKATTGEDRRLGELVGSDPLGHGFKKAGFPAPARWAATRIGGPRLAVVLALLLTAACAELRGERGASGNGHGPATRADHELGVTGTDGTVEAPAPRRGLDYTTQLTGVEEDALRELLTDSMQLIALQDRPPPSLAALRRRAEEDRERLQKALRSEGFYEATIGVSLDEGATPVAVTLDVATGPVYLLADYTIHYLGEAPPPEAQLDPETLGLHIGMPARAPAIVEAESALTARLAAEGYPFATVAKRRSVVNRDTTTMNVTVEIDSGPAAYFGATRFEGVQAVEEDYLQAVLEWQEGARYDPQKIEETRAALAETRLFTSVRVASDGEVGPDGRLPMIVRVTERSPRSIGFGVSFSSSEGLRGDTFWEHRNLFARNERLRLDLIGSEIEQSFKGTLRKPNFLRRKHTMIVDGELANRTTEAFDERSASTGLVVERPWGEYLRLRAGPTFEYSQIEDEEGERTFQLLGFAFGATRDDTDDLLNPTRGSRQDVSLTPYQAFGDDSFPFVKASLGGSAYYAIDPEARFVLAGRGRLGTLLGADTDRIPASKRFYAGGGGSIRGYEFQSVGPLDDENDPLGGRSLLELSAELRVRVTDTIGVVPFIDGGTAYDSALPDFEETLRWAAGLGFRYFTGIGPVRLDIAVPINKRENVDDDFQFYISLGQAF